MRLNAAKLQAQLAREQAALDEELDRSLQLQVRHGLHHLTALALAEAAAAAARVAAGAGAGAACPPFGIDDEGLACFSATRAARGAPPFGACLEHLRPGRGILRLDGLTPEVAADIRRLTFAAAAARLESLAASVKACCLQLQAAARPGTAAALAQARAALAQCGRACGRLLAGAALAAPDLHFALASRDRRSGAECVGEADAPQALWDAALPRLGLCREQALLMIDNARLMRSRLARLHERRAWLCGELASQLGPQLPPPAAPPPLLLAPAPPPPAGAAAAAPQLAPAAAAPVARSAAAGLAAGASAGAAVALTPGDAAQPPPQRAAAAAGDALLAVAAAVSAASPTAGAAAGGRQGPVNGYAGADRGAPALVGVLLRSMSSAGRADEAAAGPRGVSRLPSINSAASTHTAAAAAAGAYGSRGGASAGGAAGGAAPAAALAAALAAAILAAARAASRGHSFSCGSFSGGSFSGGRGWFDAAGAPADEADDFGSFFPLAGSRVGSNTSTAGGYAPPAPRGASHAGLPALLAAGQLLQAPPPPPPQQQQQQQQRQPLLAPAPAVLPRLSTDQVVKLLSLNARCERGVLLLHEQLHLALLTDEQLALLQCAASPFPACSQGLVRAISFHLLASPDTTLPWRGPPQPMRAASWRLAGGGRL